ncbi:MAG: DNA methyltransferase [archaeon]
MESIFVFSGEAPGIARAEAETLFNAKGELYRNILVAGIRDVRGGLAYTKSISRLLFRTTKQNLKRDLGAFDWMSIIKTSFALRSSGSEPELAGFIWRKLVNPIVDLNNPETLVEIIQGKSLLVAKRLWTNTEKFSNRKAHNRPRPHPSSLDPRLARAMVNLTGAAGSDTVCDPFCGTGGILIESSLMGFKTYGYDLSDEMLERCRENLISYKVNLAKSDALKLRKQFDCIVSDLPYGKSTIRGSNLYRDFLKILPGLFRRRAVIAFPCAIGRFAYGLRIEHKFSYYIHSSLTKHIYVFCQ